MTTIVLVDDHHIVRAGLRAYLEAVPGFSVIGEAADGLKVADLVERLAPEVLILDLMLPGLNGLEVVRQVRQRAPKTQIVVLSMYANEAYVLEALHKGAAAYVLKGSSGADLIQAVREVRAGRQFLSPPLSERAIDIYLNKAKGASLDIYDTLTTREREVLQLTAEGYSSTEIAGRLYISPRTVETHRNNLMRKLGLHSQRDVVLYAVRRGIIPLEN